LGTATDEADEAVVANLTDVRGGTSLGTDYDPNSSGPDVTLIARLRERGNEKVRAEAEEISSKDDEGRRAWLRRLAAEGS